MQRRIRSRDQTAFARQLRRTASKTERKLWPHLRSEQMGAPFRRQEPIGKYFADYCCLPLKLVVEVDGPWHDAASDQVRDAELGRRGFEVMRFSTEEVDKRRDDVVRAIWLAVQERLTAREAKRAVEAARSTPS